MSERDDYPTEEFMSRGDVADWIRRIARDVRSAGDAQLVHFDENGVAPAPITLSDELWLVAFQLDQKLVTLSPSDLAARRPEVSRERPRCDALPLLLAERLRRRREHDRSWTRPLPRPLLG